MHGRCVPNMVLARKVCWRIRRFERAGFPVFIHLGLCQVYRVNVSPFFCHYGMLLNLDWELEPT
jgi:hypothetical protein